MNADPSSRDARSQRGPARRRGMVLRLGILAGGVTLLTVASFGGRLWRVLDLAAHCRVHYLIAATALAVLLLVVRHWTLAALAGAVVLLNAAAIVPLYLGASRSREGPGYRLLLANVRTENVRHDLVRDLLEREQPEGARASAARPGA